MKNKASILERVATTVVDRRNLLFFFYIIAIVFSGFSMGWVKVEHDIASYLDEDSKTRRGIAIMDQEFVTFGMAEVMISNISFPHAESLAKEIERVPGVSTVTFENSPDHYKDSSAFLVILFSGEETDDVTLRAMDDVKAIVNPYDTSISTSIGVDIARDLTRDMVQIGILATIVIVIVLSITSRSYAEVIVLLLNFGVAALLNMGTNFALGKISFISNSVGVILQLALAIDYAIILCHRFADERERFSPRDAAVVALTKAIPEVASSSLTTIGGLAALAFMRFGIGRDLSVVMIKAIFLSMLTVFTLMPGLLVMLGGLIEKTKHRNLVPSVAALGRFSVKTVKVVPIIFVAVLVASFVLSARCPFVFSMDGLRARRVNETQRAKDRIADTFGTKNTMALVVPRGDYPSEARLLSALGIYPQVLTAVGLSNTQAMGGYTLTDSLTPRQFSELVDLDYEMAQVLYSLYAVASGDYGGIVGGLGGYGIPLIDLFEFLYDQASQGRLPLDGDFLSELESYHEQLSVGRRQLEGENYARMLVYLDLPGEGEETYAFIETLYQEAAKYYDREEVYAVGDSTNALDLSTVFSLDNLIISVVSVLFVVLVLTFTFQSVGLPILLISVIQASIWINFSLPGIMGHDMFFLGFLIVSSIQMGANIDYAIVVTSRYLALKEEYPAKEAVVMSLDQGFPTVITSGSILAVAGFLIGTLSTDGATSILGSYIAQGTVISIGLVVFVLPQLLYLGDKIVERTSFRIKTPALFTDQGGHVRLSGRLDGHVRGEVHAYVDGLIIGEIRPIKGGEDPGNESEGSDLT